jgi:glycosyltransferase involved in cell wall biosynthesis
MDIAIDIRNIGKKRTGDEMVFFELVRHLVFLESDHRFYLLIDRRSDDELDRVVRSLGIEKDRRFHMIVLGTGNKFIWNGWSAARYCRKNKIDIYHTQYIIPFFMPRSTKIVTHVHDISFHVYKDLITKTDAFFLNILIPFALKRCTGIIAVSQFTKNEIIKYYNTPHNKITVIHNAASDIQCGDERNDMVREKYQLPQKYILVLGTMQPRKNIPCVISAFARIADKIPHTSLVLVGKRAHNFDERIDHMIMQDSAIKNRIFFTGFVDEKDKCVVYKMADLFVTPSFYEGFGMPIVEALSMGTSVVASDIPPHKEVGGECVRYFDPHSIDQCAEVLYDVLVSGNMRKNVTLSDEYKMQFSWKRSAQKLLTLYDSLC